MSALKFVCAAIATLASGALINQPVAAEEQSHFAIELADGHFNPQHLELPSGKKIVLDVKNSSAKAIEFESFKLDREEVIKPGQSKEVYLPELSPGSYDFFDDFHDDVPEGQITVK